MDLSLNPMSQLVKATLPHCQAVAASSSQVHLPLLYIIFSHVRVEGEGGGKPNQSVP